MYFFYLFFSLESCSQIQSIDSEQFILNLGFRVCLLWIETNKTEIHSFDLNHYSPEKDLSLASARNSLSLKVLKLIYTIKRCVVLVN